MNASELLRAERVDAVLALTAARLGAQEAQRLDVFAREYFRQVDTEDLAERSPEDLLGALLSHRQFGAQREAGNAKVRVFSPSLGEDGWGSRHSVVQIVNDDMPFLVDSVTMELNRQGHNLHLIIHPIYGVERDAQGALRSIQPSRGCTSRVTGWSMPSSAPDWRMASNACWPTCVPQ